MFLPSNITGEFINFSRDVGSRCQASGFAQATPDMEQDLGCKNLGIPLRWVNPTTPDREGRSSRLAHDSRQKDSFRDMGLKPEAEGRTRLHERDPRQKEKKRDLGSRTKAEGRTRL